MGAVDIQRRSTRMIYKRTHEYGEYILEELDESEVWPNGDPIPDETIVVFLSRKPFDVPTGTYEPKSHDPQPHQPPNHS